MRYCYIPEMALDRTMVSLKILGPRVPFPHCLVWGKAMAGSVRAEMHPITMARALAVVFSLSGL